MTTLIERCLRSRGQRYFRGHHDDEFFFIVDVLADSRRGRMHVHLRPEADGMVRVGITADRFHPADRREALSLLAARWNAGVPGVEVSVYDSCDPALVGVLASATGHPADSADLTALIDTAVTGAAEFFRQAAAPAGSGDRARRSA